MAPWCSPETGGNQNKLILKDHEGQVFHSEFVSINWCPVHLPCDSYTTGVALFMPHVLKVQTLIQKNMSDKNIDNYFEAEFNQHACCFVLNSVLCRRYLFLDAYYMHTCIINHGPSGGTYNLPAILPFGLSCLGGRISHSLVCHLWDPQHLVQNERHFAKNQIIESSTVNI